MNTRRQFLTQAASGIVLPMGLAAAAAPSQLARVVVPFPAGGGTDAVARMVVEKMRGAYPAGLIVENRAGASGRMGTEYVRDANPDGSTLLFTPDFVMTIFPHSFKKLGYSPLRDFAPVALCSKTGYALVVGPVLPESVTDIAGFVAWCKANPQRAAFASTSAGSASHFIGLQLARALGVDLLHVPYKGGAPALQDLMAGQIVVGINPIGEVLPHLGRGRLRVLATTGVQRSRFVPNAPTLVEAGLKDMAVESWLGVFMPARASADTIDTASAAVRAAVQRPDVRDGLATLAMEPVQGAAADFAQVIRADMERWGPVVKASGFTAEE